jgi:hypothetical protein
MMDAITGRWPWIFHRKGDTTKTAPLLVMRLMREARRRAARSAGGARRPLHNPDAKHGLFEGTPGYAGLRHPRHDAFFSRPSGAP